MCTIYVSTDCSRKLILIFWVLSCKIRPIHHTYQALFSLSGILMRLVFVLYSVRLPNEHCIASWSLQFVIYGKGFDSALCSSQTEHISRHLTDVVSAALYSLYHFQGANVSSILWVVITICYSSAVWFSILYTRTPIFLLISYNK